MDRTYKCKHKLHTNLEAYKEAVKVFPDDCAKDSETVHLLRMGYQVCYDKHRPINEIDMKSIEERAEEYSKDKWAMGYSKELEILRAKEGYFRGATEQAELTKKEMIVKVHHTLEKVLSKEMLDKLVKVLEEE